MRVESLPFDATEGAISEATTNVPFAVDFGTMSRIEFTLTFDAATDEQGDIGRTGALVRQRIDNRAIAGENQKKAMDVHFVGEDVRSVAGCLLCNPRKTAGKIA